MRCQSDCFMDTSVNFNCIGNYTNLFLDIYGQTTDISLTLNFFTAIRALAYYIPSRKSQPFPVMLVVTCSTEEYRNVLFL